MIGKQQVMPLLLEACPSFLPKWNDYLASSYGPDDEQLLYIDLGEFARHLVDLLYSRCTEEFQSVFQVIERLHVEGDPYVKEAATIGLLEGIQNIAAQPEAFIPYLGPETHKWWLELNDFWEGKIKFVGAKIHRR
jgi:hypothetical protein